ncbi:MAG TPA: protein phosphatase, partial [Micromonosporaceae bacterium]
MFDVPAIGPLLRRAKPDQVADVAERYVTEHFAARRVEVLLADYRVFGLWPVLGSAHATAGSLHERTTAGRAFG